MKYAAFFGVVANSSVILGNYFFPCTISRRRYCGLPFSSRYDFNTAMIDCQRLTLLSRWQMKTAAGFPVLGERLPLFELVGFGLCCCGVLVFGFSGAYFAQHFAPIGAKALGRAHDTTKALALWYISAPLQAMVRAKALYRCCVVALVAVGLLVAVVAVIAVVFTCVVGGL